MPDATNESLSGRDAEPMTPPVGMIEAEPELSRAGFEEEALPCLDAVYRFSLRLTGGNEDEAEDLVQETFLRAYRAWSTYSRGTKVLSWLFTICRHVAVRRSERRGYQSERTTSELGLDGIEALSALGPVSPWDAANAIFDGMVDVEVMRAIDELPPEYRAAVVLSDLHDLRYHEIAEVLGVPTGTVKSRIHRGRRLLQRKLYDFAVEQGYVDLRKGVERRAS